MIIFLSLSALSNADMQNTIAPKQLLSRAEAAEALGVSIACLEAWAHRGVPQLPYCKIGKLAKYRSEDIQDFIQRNRGTSATAITQAQAATA